MAVWVFSPVRVLNDALRVYVEGLGFDVEPDALKASMALFDLTGYRVSLSPAPDIPCIALLGSSEPHLTEAAIDLGYDFVHTPRDGEDRLRASLNALGKRKRPARTESGNQTSAPNEAQPSLTPREAQVMSLLILGLSNKRIASRLQISERTAKFHVSALMRKYGAQGRLDLLVKSQSVTIERIGSA